jgi:hypothetical protein
VVVGEVGEAQAGEGLAEDRAHVLEGPVGPATQAIQSRSGPARLQGWGEGWGAALGGGGRGRGPGRVAGKRAGEAALGRGTQGTWRRMAAR